MIKTKLISNNHGFSLSVIQLQGELMPILSRMNEITTQLDTLDNELQNITSDNSTAVEFQKRSTRRDMNHLCSEYDQLNEKKTKIQVGVCLMLLFG